MSRLGSSSPFKEDDDPKSFMIACLQEQAELTGAHLTDDEKQALASESRDLSLSVRVRLKDLIARQIEQERWSDASLKNPRSFINAIALAGDREFPLVVQLAEEVLCENPGPEPKGNWLADKVFLLGAGLLVVLLMFGTVMLLGRILHW